MIHRIKSEGHQFEAAQDGRKRFEYRLNDRDYQVGDTLVLLELDQATHLTGREFAVKVTYILEGKYDLPSGWCIMSW